MKNLLFTLCFISGFVFVGLSQDDSSKVESVLIRIYEYTVDLDEKAEFKINVVKPDNSSETKEFNFKKTNEANRHVEIKKKLDYWYKKGYRIESSSSLTAGQYTDGVTTYYLIKKD